MYCKIQNLFGCLKSCRGINFHVEIIFIQSITKIFNGISMKSITIIIKFVCSGMRNSDFGWQISFLKMNRYTCKFFCYFVSRGVNSVNSCTPNPFYKGVLLLPSKQILPLQSRPQQTMWAKNVTDVVACPSCVTIPLHISIFLIFKGIDRLSRKLACPGILFLMLLFYIKFRVIYGYFPHFEIS